MSSSKSVVLNFLLLDLFQELRKAGMALTLEQYDLLRKAVTQGYGLGGWQDIKRVCRLLWVKPCANYDGKIFDLTFERYIQQHHDKMPVPLPAKEPKPPQALKPLSNLPQIPPRIPPRSKSPSTEERDKVQVPAAVKTGTTPSPKKPISTPFEDAME